MGCSLSRLAPLGLPGDLVTAVAQAIGLAFHEGEDPRQQLLGYLAGQGGASPAGQLGAPGGLPEADPGKARTWCPRCWRTAPGLQILATSRTRLGLGAEQILPLDGAGDGDAVKLFLLGARRARPGYQPAAEELAEIARICRTVGGLPLAILMAAAWVGILTPAEIAAQSVRRGGRRARPLGGRLA